MRNIAVAFLLSIYLFSSTQLVELFKLPSLYEHYREHRSENPTINFLEFIQLHYTSNHNPSDTKHADLPFKSIKASYSINSIAIPNSSYILANSSLLVFCFLLIGYYYSRYSFSHLAAIWQPPRV